MIIPAPIRRGRRSSRVRVGRPNKCGNPVTLFHSELLEINIVLYTFGVQAQCTQGGQAKRLVSCRLSQHYSSANAFIIVEEQISDGPFVIVQWSPT